MKSKFMKSVLVLGIVSTLGGVSLSASAIEKDKQLHLGAGVVIGMGANLITKDVLYATVGCSAIGAGKEALDELRYGGADLADFLYTAGGCFIGAQTSDWLIKPVISKDYVGVSVGWDF